MKRSAIYLVALCSPFILSCGKRQDGEVSVEKQSPKAASQALISVLDSTVKSAPSKIHELRKTAKPGDEVTVSGQVMGRLDPFVEGRAAVIIGDTSILTACNDIPGDSCETPWDNCCDTAEDKKQGTATIQIVDDSGRVLKESLEGIAGIEKLSTLLVTGIVAEGSSEDVLVIEAKAIDVVGSPR